MSHAHVDFSIYFISYLFIYFYLLAFIAAFHFLLIWCRGLQSRVLQVRSWVTRTKNSLHRFFVPNDHFITEVCVGLTQESLTDQWFPEDFDYDDITVGQTFFNACRRRTDHSQGEGLSSCLLSSMSHERTGDTHCSPWRKSRARSRISETKSLKANRLGLSWTDTGGKSSLTVKRRFKNTNSRVVMTEEVYKTGTKRASRGKNFIVLNEERRRQDHQLLHEQLLKQNWDLREVHEKSQWNEGIASISGFYISTQLQETNWSKIKILSLNPPARYRNCKMKWIVWINNSRNFQDAESVRIGTVPR